MENLQKRINICVQINILGVENSNENNLTGSKTKLKGTIWLQIQKINKHMVPNKSILVGKVLKINKSFNSDLADQIVCTV